MKSYIFKGREFVFRLSRKARVEIEEKQGSQFEVLKKLDPKVLTLFFKNNKSMDEMTEEELGESIGEMLPYIDKIKELQKDIDVYEIGYILLKNNMNYKDEMTKELFDEIVFDMEEKLGYEETEDFFMEISDKVFTIISAQEKKKQQKAEFNQNLKGILN